MRQMCFFILMSSLIHIATNQIIILQKSSCQLVYDKTTSPIHFIQCNSASSIISNWNSCATTCCYDTASSIFNLVSLEHCIQNNSSFLQSFPLYAIIVIVIVCLTVSILTGVALKRYFSKIEQQKFQLYLSSYQQEEKDKITSNLGKPNWIINPQDDPNNISPKQTDDRIKRQEHHQDCSICLNKKIEAETNCGHHFHLKCIFGWMMKKIQCPNCRKEIIFLRVKCNKCLSSYFIVSIKLTKGETKSQHFTCDGCIKNVNVDLENDLSLKLSEFQNE